MFIVDSAFHHYCASLIVSLVCCVSLCVCYCCTVFKFKRCCSFIHLFYVIKFCCLQFFMDDWCCIYCWRRLCMLPFICHVALQLCYGLTFLIYLQCDVCTVYFECCLNMCFVYLLSLSQWNCLWWFIFVCCSGLCAVALIMFTLFLMNFQVCVCYTKPYVIYLLLFWLQCLPWL